MLGIIGGTGLYSLEGIEIVEEIKVETPFGDPSDLLIRGKLGNQEVIFLPRHGKNHSLLPSEVNYRGNIFALKKMGVTQIIGVSAVGSLKEDIAPGDIAVPSQYFDWTGGKREKTFFGGGFSAHISTAEPTCPGLTEAIKLSGKKVNLKIHTDKVYACVEGPRLGTRVESQFLRSAAGCDLVGMTNIPEVFLAREAQICYATITIVTDYDCWRDDPETHVTVSMVIERFGATLESVKFLLKDLIRDPLSGPECSCRRSLSGALLSPEDSLTPNQEYIFSVLKS